MKKVFLGLAAVAFTGVVMADLAPECDQYFKEADKAMAESIEAAKAQSPDLAKQLEAAQSQYEAGKKQMASLPTDQQVSACKQGLQMLEQAKKAQAVK